MMYWSGGDWSWWGWMAMTASMFVFWGLLIWAGVMLFRRDGRPEGTSARPPGPEEILATRYARGEIDEEEYERRLSRLRGSDVHLRR